jgi:uncharacterized protein YkwD
MKAFLRRMPVLLFFVMLCVFCLPAAAQKAKPKPTPKTSVVPMKIAAFSGLETAVFEEINSLRANPAAYVKYLEEMKPRFKGNTLTYPSGTDLVTNEGVAAVNDAIASLKTTRPQAAFQLSPGLLNAASAHLLDMLKNNFTGHRGSDGSLPQKRVERFGRVSGDVKENISYYANTAREILMNMLLDDGNAKRDHRKNLLSSDLKYIGLSAGDSKSSGKICVVVFAPDFSEKGKSATKIPVKI